MKVEGRAEARPPPLAFATCPAVYSLRFSLKTQKFLIALALTALVWIVFGQTAHFDWVRYDDHDYVYRSGRVTSGLNFSNIAWAFTHFHAANWRLASGCLANRLPSCCDFVAVVQ